MGGEKERGRIRRIFENSRKTRKAGNSEISKRIFFTI